VKLYSIVSDAAQMFITHGYKVFVFIKILHNQLNVKTVILHTNQELNNVLCIQREKFCYVIR